MTRSGRDDRTADVLVTAPRALLAGVSMLLIAGVAVYGFVIVSGFTQSLRPEFERRANLIGATIHDDVLRGISLGIALEDLVGVDAYLDSLLAEFPELDSLTIRKASGGIAFSAVATEQANAVGPGARGMADGRGIAGRSAEPSVYAYPMRWNGRSVGSIDVGVDPLAARNRLRGVGLDVVVILIVALLAAFELTVAITQRIGTKGAARSSGTEAPRLAGTVGDVRLALFVFAVGEELNKSFLPLFVRSATNPFPWLDVNIAISLPIVAYLLTVAVAAPLAGTLVARFGARRLFLIALLPAAVSHLGMAWSDGLVEIVLLRMLTGVGYGLATIACQEYLLNLASPEARARTIGVFVAMVIGGTFAGTALGGILADRLGYDAVFLISFGLVLASGLFAMGMMRRSRLGEASGSSTFSWQNIVSVSRRPSLMLLMGGVTIPMNVLMAAFLWYLVPLLMADLGATASSIARALMVYYLMILFGGSLVGAVADRLSDRWALVGLGSLLSGCILLVPLASPGILTISLAVAVVGIGHAIVRGPQVALALDIADAEAPHEGRGAVLASMRALERLGSLVGLLAAGVLAARFGLIFSLGAMSVACIVAATIFLLARPFYRPAPMRAK